MGEEQQTAATISSSTKDRRKSKASSRASEQQQQPPDNTDEEEEGDEEDESPEDDEDAGDSDEEMAAEDEQATNVADTADPSPLDEKARLAANLLMLDGVHLGKVMSMLRKDCPAALEPWKETTKTMDQMEISIDTLFDTNPALFQTLASFCTEHAIPNLPGADWIAQMVHRQRADPSTLPQPHILQDEKGRGRPRASDARNIMQIDVSTGQVANVYTSLTSAAHAMGCSRHIVAGILRGTYKSKSYQGWTFKYDGVDAGFAAVEEDESTTKAKKRRKSGLPLSASPRAISVQEIDAVTGQVRRVHQSLTKAARVSGANRHVICRVLSGEIPSWQGLRWKYCDDDEEDGDTTNGGANTTVAAN